MNHLHSKLYLVLGSLHPNNPCWQISKDSGVSLLLFSFDTLPTREEQDSEAAILAWIVSISQAITAKIG